MDLVHFLETFGRSSGVFDLMNSAWGWPIAESIHFIGLSLLLGSIAIVDLRLVGFGRSIALLSLHRITRVGIVGFGLNAITGAAFFVSDPAQYLYNPAFQLKVACMLLAAINVILFYSLAWPEVKKNGRVSAAGRICAVTSIASWIGVISFGRLITFYRPPEHWCFWCT